MTPRLVTIRFSHYNEKARWALERCGVAYEEEPHLPLLHAFGVMRVRLRGGTDERTSTRYSTPVLVTDDGPLFDSTEIARYASDKAGGALYPESCGGAVEELDGLFSSRLGHPARVVAYEALLPNSSLMRQLAKENVPGVEAAIFSAGLPLFRTAIQRSLRINARSAEKSRSRIEELFDVADERLADNAFLAGPAFSLADITFSALAAPALCVSDADGYGARLPGLDEAPPILADFALRLRERPAGAHAMRMFAEYRRGPNGR